MTHCGILLLGILDKGTLTLGDNRKVDFSRALIFMTSNLGATEMSALINPRLGFNAGECARQSQNGIVDEKLSAKMVRSGADAARRKFTPEFINRLDKIVTFKPLGTNELQKDSGHRVEHGPAADLQYFAREVVRLQDHR